MTLPGAWPLDRVVGLLANRNALAALHGRPCPVAAAVVARLERLVGGAS